MEEAQAGGSLGPRWRDGGLQWAKVGGGSRYQGYEGLKYLVRAPGTRLAR